MSFGTVSPERVLPRHFLIGERGTNRAAPTRRTPVPGQMTTKQALAFIESHGVVLESGRGPVRSFAMAVAGEPIRGSWWGHPEGRAIFRLTRAIRASPEVLVCRLVDGKVTYVHRHLWPALVRMAWRFPRRRLAAIVEVHTRAGWHRVKARRFPDWVPEDVRRAASLLREEEATSQLAMVLRRSYTWRHKSRRVRAHGLQQRSRSKGCAPARGGRCR